MITNRALVLAIVTMLGVVLALLIGGHLGYSNVPATTIVSDEHTRRIHIWVSNVSATVTYIINELVCEITAYVKVEGIDEPVELVSMSVYIYDFGRAEKQERIFGRPPDALVPSKTNKITVSFPIKKIPDSIYVVIRYEKNITIHLTIPKSKIKQEREKIVLIKAVAWKVSNGIIVSFYTKNIGIQPTSISSAGLKITYPGRIVTCKATFNNTIPIQPGEAKVVSVLIDLKDCPHIKQISVGGSVYVFVVANGNEVGTSVIISNKYTPEPLSPIHASAYKVQIKYVNGIQTVVSGLRITSKINQNLTIRRIEIIITDANGRTDTIKWTPSSTLPISGSKIDVNLISVEGLYKIHPNSPVTLTVTLSTSAYVNSITSLAYRVELVDSEGTVYYVTSNEISIP